MVNIVIVTHGPPATPKESEVRCQPLNLNEREKHGGIRMSWIGPGSVNHRTKQQKQPTVILRAYSVRGLIFFIEFIDYN